jgi:hypothetical protein
MKNIYLHFLIIKAYFKMFPLQGKRLGGAILTRSGVGETFVGLAEMAPGARYALLRRDDGSITNW